MSENVIALGVAGEVVADFGEATKLTLPDRAPEIWMERDRRSREGPIQFLQRVWGPYMDAGILYQDDIKRLGDDQLVGRIRSDCFKHKLNAASFLPPPCSVRLDRALEEAAPGSAEALKYRKVIRARYGKAVGRLRQRQALKI